MVSHTFEGPGPFPTSFPEPLWETEKRLELRKLSRKLMTVFIINDKNTLLDASSRYVQQESSVFLVVLKTGTILTTLAVEIELMIQRNLIISFHGDIAINC